MKLITKAALLLSLLLTLTACNNFYLPFERKLKVQQGNIVTPEMVAKLKRGMNKNQVSFIMGTASLENTFEQARWDYIYTYQLGNNPMELRRVSVYFDKKGNVSRIEKINISDEKHTVPVAHSKKTMKTADKRNAEQTQKTTRGEKRSSASASGKPQLKGADVNAAP